MDYSDGSISLVNKNSKYYVKIALTQKNLSLVHGLRNRFGGCYSLLSTGENVYQWGVTGRKALNLLLDIHPFLYHRKEISTFLIQNHNKYDEKIHKHVAALNTKNSGAARACFVRKYSQTPTEYFGSILK